MPEAKKNARPSQTEDCYHAASAGRMGATPGESEGAGTEKQNSTREDDRQWGGEEQPDYPEKPEGDIGGILGQLRFLQQAHLEYVQAHAERLEARLRENRTHQDEVLLRMKSLEDAVARLLDFTEETQNKSN